MGVIKKIICWALGVAATSLLIQATLFHYLYYDDPCLDIADAVVVFNGDSRRIEAGFDLLKRNLSRSIMVSPATAKQMQGYQERYAPDVPAHLLYEPQARTTYENAFYSSLILKAEKIHSIILVTSADHMPRAFLLLRVVLGNSAIKVQRHSLRYNMSASSGGNRWFAEEKALYNEMVKFWGSLYELGCHRLTSKMAPRHLRESQWLRRWEERLLFER